MPEAPDEPGVDDALSAVVGAIGGQTRPGQQEMAHAVSTALEAGGHAIVQAGTGTGKSVAYLVPSALHATRSGGGPVVIASTNTSSCARGASARRVSLESIRTPTLCARCRAAA